MKTLWMLLGPSGSGKSTISGKIKRKASTPANVEVYSWDELRLRWYDAEDYSNAWELSCKDRLFNIKANNEFCRLLDLERDVIIDNTNLTPKRRKWFLKEAKNRGYKTVAVVFDVSLQTLINRQLSRPDKTVPTHAVTQQFNSFVPPVTGEFDVELQARDII